MCACRRSSCHVLFASRGQTRPDSPPPLDVRPPSLPSSPASKYQHQHPPLAASASAVYAQRPAGTYRPRLLRGQEIRRYGCAARRSHRRCVVVVVSSTVGLPWVALCLTMQDDSQSIVIAVHTPPIPPLHQVLHTCAMWVHAPIRSTRPLAVGHASTGRRTRE